MFFKKYLNKNLLINISLLTAGIFLPLLVMEFFFPPYLHKIPLRLSGALDKGTIALGQTSKNSVIPENYIALVGDSHAQGLGDWLFEGLEKNRFATPDYHSAHILHRRTKRDAITFGAGGAGSLRGIVTKPIVQYRYINSLWAFSLEKPRDILIYFYEGNDLNDNVLDLKARYFGKYDENSLYDPDYFKKFISEAAIEKDPIYNTTPFFRNFIFTRFFFKGLKELGKDAERFIRKKRDEVKGLIWPEDDDVPPKETNKVLVAGKEMEIPGKRQGPGLELTDKEIDMAVYVFERSLLYLAEYFKDASINIIYIPSVLSSYELASPVVSAQSYMKRGEEFPAQLVYSRSREICGKIEEVSKAHGFGFLDTRKSIRQGTKEELLHGPRDWRHLNKKGHHLLSEAIIAAFFSKGEHAGEDSCGSSP